MHDDKATTGGAESTRTAEVPSPSSPAVALSSPRHYRSAGSPLSATTPSTLSSQIRTVMRFASIDNATTAAAVHVGSTLPLLSSSSGGGDVATAFVAATPIYRGCGSSSSRKPPASSHSPVARAALNRNFLTSAAAATVFSSSSSSSTSVNPDTPLFCGSFSSSSEEQTRAYTMTSNLATNVDCHYAALAWKFIQDSAAAAAAASSTRFSFTSHPPSPPPPPPRERCSFIDMDMITAGDLSKPPSRRRIEFSTQIVEATPVGSGGIPQPQTGSIFTIQVDQFNKRTASSSAAVAQQQRGRFRLIPDGERKYTMVVLFVTTDKTRAAAMPCSWLDAPELLSSSSDRRMAASQPHGDDNDDDDERVIAAAATAATNPVATASTFITPGTLLHANNNSVSAGNISTPPTRLATHNGKQSLDVDTLCCQVPPLGQAVTFCSSGFELFNLCLFSGTASSSSSSSSAIATSLSVGEDNRATGGEDSKRWVLCTPSGTPLPCHSITWQHSSITGAGTSRTSRHQP